MTSKKVFWLMMALVVVLSAALVASFVLGNSVLTKQSKQLVSTKLESRLLDEQQTALTAANKDIEASSQLEQLARAIVPQDKNQARAARELVAIANDTDVKLKTISFPASNLGQTPAVGSQPPGGSSSATPAPPTTALTQVKPVNGITGVFSLEITVQSDDAAPISYASFLRFLERLEQNRRTAHVSNISIKPLANNPDQLTFSLVVNVYIKP